MAACTHSSPCYSSLLFSIGVYRHPFVGQTMLDAIAKRVPAGDGTLPWAFCEQPDVEFMRL